MSGFPRVLILAQNKMQPFTGGGVVLSNLFDQFPAEYLMFLHRDQEYDYQTPYTECRLMPSWLRLKPVSLMRQLGLWLMAGLKNPSALRLSDLSRVFAQSCWFRLPKSMDVKIEAFQPEILYAWAGDRLWAETVKKIAARYELPYVIHFMDNHVGLSPDTPLDKALYPGFCRAVAEVASGAEAIYAISGSMGRAYQALWQTPFEVFHGVIDSQKWPWPNPGSEIKDGTYRLAFTGSIEQGQLLGLQQVAGAVDALVDAGKDIELVLYLTEGYARRVMPVLGKYRCVVVRTHPRFADLRAELASVDGLVLAYGLDERTIRYYRYSFATKVVPYMLSGRPILVYGPKGIEPIDYAARGGWAVMVTGEQDADLNKQLQTQLTVLMDDHQQAADFAKAAWDAGAKEHDQTENAERFRQSLKIKSTANKPETDEKKGQVVDS